MAEHLERQGERIRQARAALNLSQEDAAHLIGVSAKTYGSWERGESEPRGRNWRLLEEHLKIRSEEIRGEPPLAQLDRMEGELVAIRVELGTLVAQVAATQRLVQRLVDTAAGSSKSRRAK